MINSTINRKETFFCHSFQYVANDENEKCFAKLLVNGTMAVTGEQILPQRGMVPKYANLYIGGIPLTFSHYFPHVAMGFIGCMDSLKVCFSKELFRVSEFLSKVQLYSKIFFRAFLIFLIHLNNYENFVNFYAQ